MFIPRMEGMSCVAVESIVPDIWRIALSLMAGIDDFAGERDASGFAAPLADGFAFAACVDLAFAA
jgi:hypothetical protein